MFLDKWIKKSKIDDIIHQYGATDEEDFWRKLSGFTTAGTPADCVQYALGKMGYTGSIDQMISTFLTTFGEETANNAESHLALLGYQGLTFYGNYERGISVGANYGVGSRTPTFTASRDATTPATYIDANGVIQLVTTSDIPRFSGGYYDGTGFHSAKGVMIEAAGTNLLPNGGFDSTNNWSTNNLRYNTTNRWAVDLANGATVTNSISTDSTYLRSAQVVVTNAGSATNSIRFRSLNGVSVTNAAVYTLSFKVKTDSAITLGLVCVDTGTEGTNRGLNSTFITTAGTWVKCSVAFTANSTDTIFFKISFGNQGLITLNIDSLQVEASPYSTSFIPTTTAALTRNAEIDSGLNAGNSTAAEETIIMKVMPMWNATSLTASTYLYDTDTKSRAVYVGTDDFVHFQPNATDTAGATVSSTTKLAINTSYVVAVVCKSTGDPNQEIFINGVSEASDNTDFTSPAWGTNFYVGCKADGTSQGNLIYQKIAKFNRALSATEVASVTTLLNQ